MEPLWGGAIDVGLLTFVQRARLPSKRRLWAHIWGCKNRSPTWFSATSPLWTECDVLVVSLSAGNAVAGAFKGEQNSFPLSLLSGSGK